MATKNPSSNPLQGLLPRDILSHLRQEEALAIVQRLFGIQMNSEQARALAQTDLNIVLREHLGEHQTADVRSYMSWFLCTLSTTDFGRMAYAAEQQLRQRRDDGDPIASDERALSRLKDALVEHVPVLVAEVWGDDQPTRHIHVAASNCTNEGTDEDPVIVFDSVDVKQSLMVAPVEEDGMLRQDARLARYLEKIGGEGSASAKRVRESSRDRWKSRPRVLAWEEPTDLWTLWIDSISPGHNLWVQALSSALWLDVIRPPLERERKRETALIRYPTPVHNIQVQARRFGGQRSREGDQVIVQPHKASEGMILHLPLDTVMVARDGEGAVPLKTILSAKSLKTYLGCLAIFQEQAEGIRDDGSFELQGVNLLLGMIGSPKQIEHKSGRTYQSFLAKDRRDIKEHLRLFRTYRVRAVGDLEAGHGDALVDVITDRSTKRITCYAHSRLVVGYLRGDYFQIPRKVCQLDARELPFALSLASAIRTKVLQHLRKGSGIVMPLVTILEAAGCDWRSLASKQGLRFWSESIERIQQIAETSCLCTVQSRGTGADTKLVLKLTPSLRAGYEPLLSISKGWASAKRMAKVADSRRRR